LKKKRNRKQKYKHKSLWKNVEPDEESIVPITEAVLPLCTIIDNLCKRLRRHTLVGIVMPLDEYWHSRT